MTQHETHFDDLDAYIAGYTDEEREELAAAELAVDLAMLFHRARESRELSQAVVAERIGLSQQAISRIERPNQNVTIETLRKYLNALNYTVEITVREPETGLVVDSVSLSPVAS
ncbi:MAG TPA: helix-turn-helix transcriptional regulator [Thermomicrobiales bacterium]|nr:helix-turn-helix transcriptional regulator [Thermomicrobiales bacterium]